MYCELGVVSEQRIHLNPCPSPILTSICNDPHPQAYTPQGAD